MGTSTASRLLLSGEIISANEAYNARICEFVEPDSAKAMEKSRALCKSMAVSAVAGPLLLRNIREEYDEGLDKALWKEADSQALCYTKAELERKILDMMKPKDK